jgi:hypothetical protein
MKRYLSIGIIFVVLVVNLTGCIATTTATTTEKTTVPVTNTVTETLIKNSTTTEKTTLTATTTSLSTVTTTATNNITTSIINNVTTTATTSVTTTATKTVTSTATTTFTSVVTTGLPITPTTSTIVVTPVGTTVTAQLTLAAITGTSPYQETHTVNITVLEVVRGSKALDMVKAADASNDFPKNGYDYLLARVKFTYGAGGILIYTVIKDYFRAYSFDNKEYAAPSIIEPKPEFIGSVFSPGQTAEGWIPFMVSQTDSKPVMIYTGTSSWFQLY